MKYIHYEFKTSMKQRFLLIKNLESYFEQMSDSGFFMCYSTNSIVGEIAAPRIQRNVLSREISV
jgi:hypothetical protein